MKLKNFILGVMAIGAVALTMTSCLDDDDDNNTIDVATPAERAAAFSSFTKNGTSGKADVYTTFYYMVDTLDTQVDWRFTNDSTVIFSNVPDSIFGRAFTSSTNGNLGKAINAGSPATVTLTGHIDYLSGNGVTYTFLSPQSTDINVSYSDQTQTFRPMFSTTQNGIWLGDNGKVGFNIAYAGYSLGTQTLTLNPAYGIIFVAK